MSITSYNFEQQIARVHELIEQPGSIVTWDEKIPDPDNPAQMRQIDITIRRDESLTLVECRIHKRRQDVNWIEELIGRKISLDADAVIAVSASGFTKGAILKAKEYGVILRDILSLSEEEIKEWGKKTKVSVTFFEFTNAKLVLQIDNKYKGKISIDEAGDYLSNNRNELYGIFQIVSDAVEKENPKGLPCEFNAALTHKGLNISGINVTDFKFSSKFKHKKVELSIPFVLVYDAPVKNALERNVFIEAVETGNFEITQSSDNVYVALDLSKLEIPENCLFRYVNFDFNRIITMESMEFLGIPKMGIKLELMELMLEFVN